MLIDNLPKEGRSESGQMQKPKLNHNNVFPPHPPDDHAFVDLKQIGCQ